MIASGRRGAKPHGVCMLKLFICVAALNLWISILKDSKCQTALSEACLAMQVLAGIGANRLW